MALIWDEGRLVNCAGPPGVVHGAGLFQPNCFAGIASRLTLDATRYPMITPGVADFSVEFWYRALDVSDGHAGDDTADIGFWYNPTTGANAALAFNYYKFSGEAGDVRDRCQFRTVAPLAPLVREINSTPVILRWNHYVINNDRSADMELWRNGAIIANGAINLENIPQLAFAPWVGADIDGGTGWEEWHDDDLTEFDFKHFNGIIGPIAVHTGAGSLMTAAEIQESIERRYVRLDANTQVLFDWRDLLAVQGWDGDRTHIIRGISDYTAARIAAPEGADGTIIVPDLSGNGNDWILTTRPAYNATGITAFAGGLTGLSCCAFASDPFFQHGGLS